MIINKLAVESDREVTFKIVHEILTLFKIDIDEKAQSDYNKLTVKNAIEEDGSIVTQVFLQNNCGKIVLCRREHPRADENLRAAQNRLIKLNLYYLFTCEFGVVAAPWGILHGVRPTKIVHRFIDEGMLREDIIERLSADYAVSEEKAVLLTDIAYSQLPVMRTSDSHTVSIYIGVPFCLTRCLYCSFPANILPEDDGIAAFMAALHKEVLSLKDLIKLYNLKVQNIYIGGGTPTSLPEKYFSQLLNFADELHNGDLREYTVEAGRPDSITRGKIKLMAQHHVGRISVNPQSMHERTLRIIGRNHMPEDIERIYHEVRELSTAHINMDIILGLPGETAEDVRYTVEKIIEMAPDDITVHALAIKKGSKLKTVLDKVQLPDDETVRAMAQITQKLLQKAGYVPYYLYRQGYMSGQLENTGYCRPGCASLYNIQIMSERQTILGIGGSASTKIAAPSRTYLRTLFNPKDVKTYLQSVDDYIVRRSCLMREVYEDEEK